MFHHIQEKMLKAEAMVARGWLKCIMQCLQLSNGIKVWLNGYTCHNAGALSQHLANRLEDSHYPASSQKGLGRPHKPMLEACMMIQRYAEMPVERMETVILMHPAHR